MLNNKSGYFAIGFHISVPPVELEVRAIEVRHRNAGRPPEDPVVRV